MCGWRAANGPDSGPRPNAINRYRPLERGQSGIGVGNEPERAPLELQQKPLT
jgi:hypothetical protein